MAKKSKLQKAQEKVEKRAERLEKSMAHVTALRTRDGTGSDMQLLKTESDLQLEYLHRVSPSAARVYEERRREEEARRAATSAVVPPSDPSNPSRSPAFVRAWLERASPGVAVVAQARNRRWGAFPCRFAPGRCCRAAPPARDRGRNCDERHRCPTALS
jgi:hypothetical protein